jgi:hypothetical protein
LKEGNGDDLQARYSATKVEHRLYNNNITGLAAVR